MLEFKTKIVFDPPHVTKKHVAQSSWKYTVMCETNDDMHLYYAWFLNKRFNLPLNRPLRNPHVTIVNEKIQDMELYKMAKKLFNGKEITFKFDPAEIRTDTKHWWIRVQSDDVANIRTVMGLPPKPFFGLHLTIGMANEKNIEHSKYIHEQILRFNL